MKKSLQVIFVLSFTILQAVNFNLHAQEFDSYEEYIRKSTLEKSEIDVFVNPKIHSWANFDSQLGYVLGNDMLPGAINNSKYISTIQTNSARTMHMYKNKPCRINTYGDSFTYCSQVSDGETWQEYLAAHLGEPVRNFGMGGYGVYQAYLRMLREEKTENSVENVMLYIWGGDHFRSLMSCRYVTFHSTWDNKGGRRFHNNFWAHLEMNVETGNFEEKENLLSTPESMYEMMDADFMYENTKDNLMIQMTVYLRKGIDGLDRERLKKLANILNLSSIDFSNDETLKGNISQLRDAYGFAATKYILKKSKQFADKNNKNLMIVLFDPYKVTKSLINDGTRYDQGIVDYLVDNNYNYFDMNVVHAEDYKSFNLSVDDYFKRYFIGHYKPAGNHFFAFSMMDKVVQWLNPKPITYRTDGEEIENFDGYLEK